MSKPNGFIRIERELWASDQWRSLSANAQLVLVDMLYRYTTRNNGQIVYGLRDGIGRLHCHKTTAMRALDELKKAGLIEPTVKASFDLKGAARKGQATQWRLTFMS